VDDLNLNRFLRRRLYPYLFCSAVLFIATSIAMGGFAALILTPVLIGSALYLTRTHPGLFVRPTRLFSRPWPYFVALMVAFVFIAYTEVKGGKVPPVPPVPVPSEGPPLLGPALVAVAFLIAIYAYSRAAAWVSRNYARNSYLRLLEQIRRALAYETPLPPGGSSP